MEFLKGLSKQSQKEKEILKLDKVKQDLFIYGLPLVEHQRRGSEKWRRISRGVETVGSVVLLAELGSSQAFSSDESSPVRIGLEVAAILTLLTVARIKTRRLEILEKALEDSLKK